MSCGTHWNPIPSASGGTKRTAKNPNGRATKDQQIALRNFAIVWAGVQVHKMKKTDMQGLHVLMREKYDEVALDIMGWDCRRRRRRERRPDKQAQGPKPFEHCGQQ